MSQIASSAQVNLWIDRRIDPELAVTIPAGTKSVFRAIADAAQSVGLEAAAAGNVVLVGRRQWVTDLAGAILALSPELSQPSGAPPIDWPELTTPSEAIKIVTATDGPDTLALPHDLWPAVSWNGVSPQLAVLLITAQFDLMPVDLIAVPLPDRQDVASLEPLSEDASGFHVGPSLRPAANLRPLQAPATLVVVYPNGPHLTRLRESAVAADPQSRFRTGRPGAPLELTGSPAAHTAAAAAYFSHARAKRVQAPSLDGDRFTLRLRDAPAKDVFAQLATTAGKSLRIADAASAACHGRVTLEGKDVTLRELVDRVASEVGVAAIWTHDSLQIELTGGRLHPLSEEGKIEAPDAKR